MKTVQYLPSSFEGTFSCQTKKAQNDPETVVAQALQDRVSNFNSHNHFSVTVLKHYREKKGTPPPENARTSVILIQTHLIPFSTDFINSQLTHSCTMLLV